MRKFLDAFFDNRGYGRISSNIPEFTIYFHIENNLINVIHVIDNRPGFYLFHDQYEDIRQKIYHLFLAKGFSNIHILSLIISVDIQKAKLICREDRFCWIINPENRRLIVLENQVENFYGLRTELENGLEHTEQEISEWGQRHGEEAEIQNRKAESQRKRLPAWKELREYQYVNIGLVAANIVLFLLCTFAGEMLYNSGVLYGPSVLEDGQYYRLITAMFLHGDINHLFGNMIILFFLGEIVEKEMGHLAYFLVYMLSGLGGGILSVWFEYYSGNFVGSIGASGAVFGMIGALFYLVIRGRGRLETFTFGKVLFLIVYSLYSGFTGTNTDNAAHIGGLVTGFVLTAAGYLLFARGKQTGEEQP